MRAKFRRYLKTTNTWTLVGITIILAVILTTLLNLIFAQTAWGDQITSVIIGLGMLDAFISAALIAPVLIIMLKRAARLEEINRELEQEMAGQRHIEQAAVQRAANLTLINEMALACAIIDAEADLPQLIAEKLHALTQSVAVAITTYDPQKQTLAVQHVSASGRIFSVLEKVWGHNIIGVGRPLDPELKQRMLAEVVFITPDVTGTILGLIPRPIAISLQKTLGVSSLTALSLIYQGELWGTAAIILRDDQSPLEGEVALALSHIIAMTMHRQAAEKALRRAEEKYRSIVENAMEGIFQSTPDGHFVSVNPAMARMYGYAGPQEMVQSITNISEQIYVDSQDRADLRHRLETEGFVQDFASQDRRKDGSAFWTSMNVRSVRDEHGRTLYYEGTVEDITARKQVEEALRQSQERYANFVEQSLEGIWMLAFDKPIPLSLPEEEQARHLQALGYVAECNNAMARMYGYGSSRELIGKRVEELYGGLSDEANFASTLKLVQSGYRAGNRETHEVTKTGETVYFLNNAVGVIENECLVALWGTQQDITALKQAEQALRESEERFRTLLDKASNIAVQGYQLDGTVIYWNKASEQIYGYTAAEALGQNLVDIIIPPDMRDEVRAAIKQMSETGEGHSPEELWLMRKDGSLTPVYSNHTVIDISGGKELFCIDIDLTERKQAEKVQAQLEEQLRQAQKMETVGQLAGGVAHDFNNMLTAILGFSELLLSSADVGEGAVEYIEQIREAAERAASLTQQLLAFSRKQMLQPKIFNLNTLVVNIETMLQRLIGEHIELIAQLDPRLGQVEADPAQIDQILMNLAVNARDAMPNGGKLTIETKNVYLDEVYARQYMEVEPGPYVMLAVTDTGSGMDKETQAHLFEPFFTTKEVGKGTGLGLATIYGIVRQSDGHIWVYSEVGRGTTFKIYLPWLEEDIPIEAHAVPIVKLQGGDETILLVEDAEMVRTLARNILEEGGYTVLEASDGNEALRMCQKYRGTIHLLLTDVVMPGMSGRKLAEQIKTMRPEIKILYMSGYTDDAIVHHGVLEPGIAFLEKPFSATALARKLREVLDNTR